MESDEFSEPFEIDDDLVQLLDPVDSQRLIPSSASLQSQRPVSSQSHPINTTTSSANILNNTPSNIIANHPHSTSSNNYPNHASMSSKRNTMTTANQLQIAAPLQPLQILPSQSSSPIQNRIISSDARVPEQARQQQEYRVRNQHKQPYLLQEIHQNIQRVTDSNSENEIQIVQGQSAFRSPSPTQSRKRKLPGPIGDLSPIDSQGKSCRRRKTWAEVMSVPQSATRSRSNEQQQHHAQRSDKDFKRPSWIEIKKHITPFDFDNNGLRSVWLSSCEEKIPRLVVILKEIKYTESNVSAVFKDPSDEISATIHKRAIEVLSSTAPITIGAAFELENVSIFKPTKRSRHLIIVLENVKTVVTATGNLIKPSTSSRSRRQSSTLSPHELM